MDYANRKPSEVRALIREGKITGQTSGMCDGYAQGNLLILPKEYAYDFLLFTQRNPKSCPILEVGNVGSRLVKRMAAGGDIATDIPMYLTNIDCEEAGIFHGRTVVSMRPMTPANAIRAVSITASMPRVHGAPVHIGDPAQIGITDISSPDFGDAVTIKPGEIPVFWCCGVTPQSAVMSAKPKFAISHAPGHMFITDIKNSLLKD